jgi:hypothetical protein
MNQGHNTMHFKINSRTIHLAICNIPHNERLIKIRTTKEEKITFINMKYLKQFPIDTQRKYLYMNNYAGELGKRTYEQIMNFTTWKNIKKLY